jgi:poly(hydroxyalkanoate) granule-associated protein
MNQYVLKVEETARQLPPAMMEASRKVWLAGMGAVGVIGNTTTTLFETLVDEGKRVQKVEKDLLDKAVTKTTDTVTGVVNDVMTKVQHNVQLVTKTALNRLGMPSRGDVAALAARVEALTVKVELLGKKGAAHGA